MSSMRSAARESLRREPLSGSRRSRRLRSALATAPVLFVLAAIIVTKQVVSAPLLATVCTSRYHETPSPHRMSFTRLQCLGAFIHYGLTSAQHYHPRVCCAVVSRVTWMTSSRLRRTRRRRKTKARTRAHFQQRSKCRKRKHQFRAHVLPECVGVQ
jgi:hypothetical protein